MCVDWCSWAFPCIRPASLPTNAPHTATSVSASEWTHAYPRELAAFPLPSLKLQKYWPPVARVDNVYGDKNVMCACIPVDAYKDEVEA